MRKLAQLIALVMALGGCSSGWTPPPDYYENNLHHGYPGPGVTAPGGGG